MAISIASAFLPEFPRASRQQYQRARDMLPFAWPSLCEAHELQHVDFLLLTVILSNQPGRLFRQAGSRRTNEGKECRRQTMGFADWLGISRTTANQSVSRLNAAGLLWGLMYEAGDELPFGTHEPARTNIIEYRVSVATIERHYNRDAFQGSRRRPSPPSNSGPSDGSEFGPSSKLLGSDQPPTPKPPSSSRRQRARGARDTEAAPPQGERDERADAPTAPDGSSSRAERAGETDDESPAPDAFGDPVEPSLPTSPRGEQRRGGEQDSDHEKAVFSQWDALRVPEKGGTVSRIWRANEATTIRKRLADCGVDRVRLAILAAAADPFLRGGHANSAVAVVFGRREKTLAFARAGELLERQRWADRVQARAEVLKDRAWRERRHLSDEEAGELARAQVGPEPWRRGAANDVEGGAP
jgi:hypothetical protein